MATDTASSVGLYLLFTVYRTVRHSDVYVYYRLQVSCH